ncbi:MAG: hypothetical protein IKI76_00220 [Selenomonadaceae bacterium]|nr:hypothetical protein [Selenomonadaceae bacterium]
MYRNKEYNPCGDLTGRERELCDEASKNYFNLPFVEVMRAISIKAIAELEHKTNFRNVDALKNWSAYNLNEVEQRANLNFDTFTPLQAGLCKYLVHLLYENRYNIHYNALTNYCRTLDDIALTEEELERKINSIAQEANSFSTVDDLTGELWNFLAA